MKRAALAALSALAMTAIAAADGLSSVRWEYRPLLLFTPTPLDNRLSRQTTILANDDRGLIDRRLAVFVVERNRVVTLFGAPAPEANAKRLRLRFRVPDASFRVVLIGLDGGAKLTSDAPVTAETLFSTIDAMPMRRRELRERAVQEKGG